MSPVPAGDVARPARRGGVLVVPALAQQVAPLRCRPSLDGVGRGLGDGIAAAAVGRAKRMA